MAPNNQVYHPIDVKQITVGGYRIMMKNADIEMLLQARPPMLHSNGAALKTYR